MLESNPPPGDVMLWMPGTYLWLADPVENPYLEGSFFWKLVGVFYWLCVSLPRHHLA